MVAGLPGRGCVPRSAGQRAEPGPGRAADLARLLGAGAELQRRRQPRAGRGQGGGGPGAGHRGLRAQDLRHPAPESEEGGQLPRLVRGEGGRHEHQRAARLAPDRGVPGGLQQVQRPAAERGGAARVSRRARAPDRGGRGVCARQLARHRGHQPGRQLHLRRHDRVPGLGPHRGALRLRLRGRQPQRPPAALLQRAGGHGAAAEPGALGAAQTRGRGLHPPQLRQHLPPARHRAGQAERSPPHQRPRAGGVSPAGRGHVPQRGLHLRSGRVGRPQRERAQLGAAAPRGGQTIALQDIIFS